MDLLNFSPDDASDMMESMMEVMDAWSDRGWTMRPQSCSSCHGRGFRCTDTPVRRPFVECRPLNLGDLLSPLEASAELSASRIKGDRDHNRHSHRNCPKDGGDVKQTPGAPEGRGSGSDRGQGQDTDKPWQYSVDVGGCDEVRAYTESGMLMVEGRGRKSDSSMKVLYMTRLPPHIKTYALTATLKQDGHLVLRQPSSDAAVAGVTNIAITSDQEPPEPQQASDKE